MKVPNLANNGRQITVIFLLYSESKYVPGLVNAILKQTHPTFAKQSEWMEVLFVDNGSTDDTLASIESELKKTGFPENYRILHIEKNEGISRALNQAFRAVQTPYAMTCHCDVLFGREDYVATLADLLAAHPQAGAIAGQPTIPLKATIPFAEKVNLVANLMDIFPASERAPQAGDLTPVGFVEGRCDGFRIAALQAVNYYDTTLKYAGEDQILAANMRTQGFELFQSPHLPYSLSVSSDQDSVSKIIRHQRLFGRAHPFIVLKNRGAIAGIAGKSAGDNRQARTILRASQLLSTGAYLLSLALLMRGQLLPAAIVLGCVFALKQWIFSKHIRAVALRGSEYFKFLVLQPALDFSYTFGLLHGIWILLTPSGSKSIH